MADDNDEYPLTIIPEPLPEVEPNAIKSKLLPPRFGKKARFNHILQVKSFNLAMRIGKELQEATKEEVKSKFSVFNKAKIEEVDNNEDEVKEEKKSVCKKEEENAEETVQPKSFKKPKRRVISYNLVELAKGAKTNDE